MKTLSTFLFIMLVTFSSAQVCTIDYSQNTPGIYPAVLPNAIKGLSYNEEITILFPSSDNGVNYSSFRISSIELPMGLTWECSNESTHCVYVPQEDPFACLRIFGTPSESGQFVIKVFAQALQTNNLESVYLVQTDLEVEVSSSANGVFTYSPIVGCESAQVDFTLNNPINYTPIANQTTGISNNWDFGNGTLSNQASPLTQTYTGVGQYIVTHTQVLDTVGFKLRGVTINTVGCTDTWGYGEPDIYIELYDGSNNMVYTTVASLNSAVLPQTYSLNILLNNPPYQIRVMDDDSDNLIGKAPDNCVNGEDDSPVKTAIDLPLNSSFGTTIQVGSNGSLNFTYNIHKDTIHVETTDTINIFANPIAPSIIADMNTPITLSTNDLGYVYHWNMDSQRIHSLRGAEVVPELTGSYTLTAVDENGCFSTSNPEVVNVTGLATLNDLKFKIYPNPANSILNIEFAESINNGEVIISDLSGRILNQHLIKNQNLLKLDVSALAIGVYTIAIVNEIGQVSTKKLLVQ